MQLYNSAWAFEQFNMGSSTIYDVQLQNSQCAVVRSTIQFVQLCYTMTIHHHDDQPPWRPTIMPTNHHDDQPSLWPTIMTTNHHDDQPSWRPTHHHDDHHHDDHHLPDKLDDDYYHGDNQPRSTTTTPSHRISNSFYTHFLYSFCYTHFFTPILFWQHSFYTGIFILIFFHFQRAWAPLFH